MRESVRVAPQSQVLFPATGAQHPQGGGGTPQLEDTRTGEAQRNARRPHEARQPVTYRLERPVFAPHLKVVPRLAELGLADEPLPRLVRELQLCFRHSPPCLLGLLHAPPRQAHAKPRHVGRRLSAVPSRSAWTATRASATSQNSVTAAGTAHPSAHAAAAATYRHGQRASSCGTPGPATSSSPRQSAAAPPLPCCDWPAWRRATPGLASAPSFSRCA
jgi:hypothetical protein